MCIQRSTDKIGDIVAALNESLNTVADIPKDADNVADNVAAEEDSAMMETGGHDVTEADEENVMREDVVRNWTWTWTI